MDTRPRTIQARDILRLIKRQGRQLSRLYCPCCRNGMNFGRSRARRRPIPQIPRLIHSDILLLAALAQSMKARLSQRVSLQADSRGQPQWIELLLLWSDEYHCQSTQSILQL
jgi:hypothetical protein